MLIINFGVTGSTKYGPFREGANALLPTHASYGSHAPWLRSTGDIDYEFNKVR